ncbi:MAG: 2-C-methyl-D-erythritol 4-phosphate cytidylyltransferase [Roseburia sp.]|nr:2-C-methyl-D-erythritol 4-phosphate cytidylyltransferase [Roseburia sp.]
MDKYAAIVLAAGAGKRMNSSVRKQYMELAGKPVLYYSLKAFEESPVSEIILVVGAGEIEYCRQEIAEKYNFTKIKIIVEGGKERYHSVYEGLKAVKNADYVLIHDGARPFVDKDIIHRSIEAAKLYGACVTGMTVKDTIKIVDSNGFAEATPDRSHLWQIQTPQTFFYPLIYEAYQKMIAAGDSNVTDDAMVLERATGQAVKVIEGSYRNVKITTPEDLLVAEAFLTKK